MAKAKQGQTKEMEYSKKKLLEMKRYANRVDLLEALLNSGELYTLKAVDAAIGEFMKGEVS